MIQWFLVSDLKERIRPPEYGRRYIDAKNNRTKDTNQWIFENNDFKTWRTGGNSTLLLTGECRFSRFLVVGTFSLHSIQLGQAKLSCGS